ncbi:hypothetical protein CC86DRAFT_462853 [Ophiobolus disseminans]|uniref:Uncharacterized protein n=1 Tax=Ophiobolus disseminans TaxID=1469910 RepID=A0A6A7AIU3_9PLEO|nr:hypothetical protein CC86DRAFT_462853 [Ophiobolus disseminans]
MGAWVVERSVPSVSHTLTSRRTIRAHATHHVRTHTVCQTRSKIYIFAVSPRSLASKHLTLIDYRRIMVHWRCNCNLTSNASSSFQAHVLACNPPPASSRRFGCRNNCGFTTYNLEELMGAHVNMCNSQHRGQSCATNANVSSFRARKHEFRDAQYWLDWSL